MTPSHIDKIFKIFEQFDGDESAEVIGKVLILALATFSVVSRNKEQTLVEPFDTINEAYKKAFEIIQRCGVEQIMDKYRAEKR